MLTSEFWLGEEVWSKLHGCLHVSFDLHLTLHECVLRVEFSLEQIECVLVQKGKSGISLSLFAVLNWPWSVFQINSPSDGLLAFSLSDFEMVDESNFFNNVSSLLLEERFHFIKACGGFQRHIYKKGEIIYNYDVGL